MKYYLIGFKLTEVSDDAQWQTPLTRLVHASSYEEAVKKVELVLTVLESRTTNKQWPEEFENLTIE